MNEIYERLKYSIIGSDKKVKFIKLLVIIQIKFILVQVANQLLHIDYQNIEVIIKLG